MPLPVGKRERERAGLGLPSRLKKPGGQRIFNREKSPGRLCISGMAGAAALCITAVLAFSCCVAAMNNTLKSRLNLVLPMKINHLCRPRPASHFLCVMLNRQRWHY